MSLPSSASHQCHDARWPAVPCQPPWHLYGWLMPQSIPTWLAARRALALEAVLRCGEHVSPIDVWVHEACTDAQMRAGELKACPDRCDWNGGCKYPSVCRSER